MNEMPLEEIIEARNGPFNNLWLAIRAQDPELFREREVATELLGALFLVTQFITPNMPNGGTYSMLLTGALNVLTGWRGYDEGMNEEFNDCENYDDPFAPEWDDEEDEDERPAKEIWSRR